MIRTKDVSKAVKGGSLKQRLKLIAEHYASIQTGGKGLFTDREAQDLIDEFKTPVEIDRYNQLQECDKRVRNALLLLQIGVGEYKEALAQINAYCLLWEAFNSAEEMANSMLYEVTDKTLRKKLVKRALESSFFYSKMEADESGEFIRLSTDKSRSAKPGKEGYNLEAILRLWSKKATILLSEIKGMSSAIEDYMDEKDFKPKAYRDLLDRFLEPVKEDRSLLPKYSRKRMKEALTLSPEQEGLYSKYFVYPVEEEIEADRETYKQMRELQLDYER